MTHILSWNVNGIRAITKKGFIEDILNTSPDIFCLQETKATPSQVGEACAPLLETYDFVANDAEKKGYSGTAIFYKKKPISITKDLGIQSHDTEGRVITAEYQDFYLVTVYTPNSGSELKRLSYRQQWDQDFLTYLKKLEQTKPVVCCGDLNVAHRSIDLKNAKANYNKSAGHMQEEIEGMDNYINNGFLDTFRHLHPEEIKYSWWSYRAAARQRNIGWRIDYFIASKSIEKAILAADIHNEMMGSDHCPVSIKLSLS